MTARPWRRRGDGGSSQDVVPNTSRMEESGGDMVTSFSQTFGTMELLANLAMGRIKESPFPPEAVGSSLETSRKRQV